ncbi:hypothetical protein OAA06_01885, partial [bacterium]|nr:hypothetical protein [bacterium]
QTIWSQNKKYFASFSDKNNSAYTIENPQEFLSLKAIQRRTNQGLSVNNTDLPVIQNYVDGVASTGETALLVVDFAEDADEKQDNTELWNQQVDQLKHGLGSV